MTTVLSRPRRADVRARILAAAAEAFFRHGYAETTVADVAAAAGFTKGAVYSNFGGKPELFVAVFTDRAASITELALAESGPTAGHTSTSEVVAAVAQTLTRQVTADATAPAALAEFRALAVRDEAVRAAYDTLRLQQRRQLEDQLRARADALRLPPTFDFAVAANLLLTVTNGLATEHAAAPDATPPGLILATLSHVLGSMLP